MEMNVLTSGNSRVPSSSLIRNLDTFLDEGLIRVGGRLDKSSMPAQMKHLVIFPKDHHVSVLILRQIHSSLLHSGRNPMLANLREQFWLIHAPSAIRKIISKFVTCRRYMSKVEEQKMASLP